jgi:hypothetical protein
VKLHLFFLTMFGIGAELSLPNAAIKVVEDKLVLARFEKGGGCKVVVEAAYTPMSFDRDCHIGLGFWCVCVACFIAQTLFCFSRLSAISSMGGVFSSWTRLTSLALCLHC